MRWQTLLVPHDFSPAAARALALALDLAALSGGRLAVMHISPLPHGLHADSKIVPEGATSAVRVDEYMTAAARRKLEALLQERGATAEIFVVAAEQEPAAMILGKAKELGADVIVMGTHGRSGVRRLLLGSVAEEVLRRADVPVVVVRDPGDRDDAHLREEEVALDEDVG